MSFETTQASCDKAMLSQAKQQLNLSGFDRNNENTMGQMEYCIDASSHDYWRIEADGTASFIESTTATTFSDGTALADLTLVHFPTSGQSSFSYWYQGALITKTTTQSVTFSADSKQYVFYNSSGVLTAATTESSHTLIVDETLIAYISAYTYAYFADERHGIVMDGETHYMLHFSSMNGFTHHRGGDIAGIKHGVATHGAVSNSGFFDEDILTSIDGDIAEDGTLPWIYMSGTVGTSAVWIATTYDSDMGYGGTSPQFNDPSGGTWGLSTIPGGNFTMTTFWASNNVINPVVKMVGQAVFGSRKLARRHIGQEIFDIKTTGLPAPEMQLIGAAIIDSSGETFKGEDDEDWYDYRRGFSVDRYTVL